MDINHIEIEKKWKKFWFDHQTYKTYNESNKPKYYVLDMFPYPSGSGLHVGHPLGYIASDIIARSKRMKGYNVLHPMGYDAFGLPAEQYAIQTGVHPEISTEQNIKTYRSQLDNIGFSYDWSREVKTCDPLYYKWTQWIFIQLFENYYDNTLNRAKPISELVTIFEKEGNINIDAPNSCDQTFSSSDWQNMNSKERDEILMGYRLAYRKVGYVNWCEALGTVLANDEVKDGVSERGGHPVERKPMMQWSLRITAYAERLLHDMKSLDWPEALKTMQTNWIGRSEGAQVFFEIENHQTILEIFTTRPDTIFGATFMVLAPEHDLVKELTTAEQQLEIEACINIVKSKSERDRMAEVKEMNGAFTGSYCIHPFSKERIPVWIGDYVLKDYGTGAIMAVPADDDRDQNFAKKYNLPIVEVVDKSKYPGATLHDKIGVIINSDFLNGLEVLDAITLAATKLEDLGIGKLKINYKLRDANFSRQRYWGEPIPIKYDKDGVSYALETNELPLTLPPMDEFKPSADGQSPLSKLQDWVTENGYIRETDTMPGFAGSSWYFLRYMDADNPNSFASKEALNYWQDVDFYIGGAEHAVGHLMYSRFWHKFLYDKGQVPTQEPFKKLINQGMITGEGYYLDYIFYADEDEINGVNYKGEENFTVGNFDEFLHKGFVTKVSESQFRLPYIKEFLDSNNRFYKSEYENYINKILPILKSFVSKDYFYWVKDINSQEYFTIRIVSEKMSKSKYNVINPDDMVHKYGADCFRMYEMFLGPIEQSKPWDTKGIEGVSKFLRKFWNLIHDDDNLLVSDETPTKEELKILHTCIKKINEDLENFSLNTSISAFMVCVNELKRLECNKRIILDALVRLIAPFAPFISEELWTKLGNTSSVHHAAYPQYQAEYLVEESIVYPLCFNGKKKHELTIDANATISEIEKIAISVENLYKWTDGKEVKKVVVVSGRMINIVC